MIHLINQFINTKFQTLPYINKVLGAATIIERDGEKFPAYNQAGESQHINFDAYKSCIYFISNGRVNRETQEHPFIGTKEQVVETYPIRAIIYSQGLEDINCNSVANGIATGVKKNISGTHDALREALGADIAVIKVTETELDKSAVWRSQYSSEMMLKETDTLIAVDFDVEIKGDEQCFESEPCQVTDSVFYITKSPDEMYDFITNASQTFLLNGSTQGFSPLGGFDDLRNKTVTEVHYDGIFLSPAYSPVPYSFNSVTGLLTFNITITEGVAVRVKYKNA